jgi:hypothetical protein
MKVTTDCKNANTPGNAPSFKLGWLGIDGWVELVRVGLHMPP